MTIDRSEVLRLANQYIVSDRAATHGKAEDSFGQIAGAWNWWLAERLTSPLTAFDVAQMMGLFKDARIKGNPTHSDSYIDGCGYRAIAAEIASKTTDK